MNRLQRLWHYCPLPLKRRYGLLQRLAVAFHLPPLDRLVSVPPQTLGLVSLLTSILVFYFGTITTATLITGTLTGIGVYLANPIWTLLSIPIFLGVWAIIHFILSASQRKGARAVLFTILALMIITPGFTICLASGVFNSITLSSDSFIDLSHCTVFLDIHNIGFKDVAITNVTVGSLVWEFPSLNSVWWNVERLPRGENVTLTLVYAYSYYGMPGMYSNLDGPYNLAGSGIDPTTFHEGETYPVKIQTDGPISFKYHVEARYLMHEEIQGIHANISGLFQNRTEGNETYCLPQMTIRLDMPSKSFTFVHSVTFGPLTLTFEQPILIPMLYEFSSYQPIRFFYLDYRVSASGQYSALVTPVGLGGGVIKPALASQPLTSPLFRVGETYGLTVRTMENNNYTATITMKVT